MNRALNLGQPRSSTDITLPPNSVSTLVSSLFDLDAYDRYGARTGLTSASTSAGLRDSQIVRMTDDEDKFELMLDVQDYRPEELKVRWQRRAYELLFLPRFAMQYIYFRCSVLLTQINGGGIIINVFLCRRC